MLPHYQSGEGRSTGAPLGLCGHPEEGLAKEGLLATAEKGCGSGLHLHHHMSSLGQVGGLTVIPHVITTGTVVCGDSSDLVSPGDW